MSKITDAQIAADADLQAAFDEDECPVDFDYDAALERYQEADDDARIPTTVVFRANPKQAWSAAKALPIRDGRARVEANVEVLNQEVGWAKYRAVDAEVQTPPLKVAGIDFDQPGEPEAFSKGAL